MAGVIGHYTRWPDVEGFVWPHSFTAGDTVPVRCTSRGEPFAAVVTRVGSERVEVWRHDGLRCDEQPIGDRAWVDGCDWPVTFTIETSRDWPPGFYEIALVANSNRSEAFFVLGSAAGADTGDTDGLLVLATNTYAAYNQWGGACLYSGADTVSFARPLERGYLRRPPAPAEVSFDGRVAHVGDEPDPEHLALQRYQADNHYPLWSASSGWHNWERRFVAWAEGAGFTFDYAVNADVHDRPEILDRHRLLLSVGHDEYWTAEMRDAVDRFVDDGGSWGIFSGNTCFWQVRYSDDRRSMIGYKGSARSQDPVVAAGEPERATTMWSSPLVGRPETWSTGLTFSRGGYARIGQGTPRSSGGFTVQRADHWAFEGTDLRYGDVLGGPSTIVGYEVDGCELALVDGLPVPTGNDGAPVDMEILATAPARLLSITETASEAPAALWASNDPPGDLEGVAIELFGSDSPEHVAKLAHGHAVMGTFGRGRGQVFNVGTTDWAYGLDGDPLVQRITANVLRRFGSG